MARFTLRPVKAEMSGWRCVSEKMRGGEAGVGGEVKN